MTNPYFTGLTSGVSAGQSFGNSQPFQMNGGGIFGGVASGALSGAAAGPIGAAIGGLTGGVTSFFKQDNQLKNATENVNTTFDGVTDIYGRPVYQGFAQGVQDFQGLTQATQPGRYALRPRRRRQMERKAQQLFQGIMEGQHNYNQAESRFRDRNLQMQDYIDRNQSRLYNLY